SGNNNHGINLQGATSGTLIQGNLIGTDVTGTLRRGNTGNGVLITAGATANTVGGLTSGLGNVISANNGNGVQIDNSSTTGNLVEGNRIGTDVAGTANLGNGGDGVLIVRSASATTVGGSPTGARNIISGNGANGVELLGKPTGNLVAGNFIGTDVNGTAALPNQGDGVRINFAGQPVTTTSGNTVGGTASGFRNVISGNGQNGVDIGGQAPCNVVVGNYIGTDVHGTAALGNAINGVLIQDAASNTVGGSTAAARNLISGNGTSINGGNGVQISGSGASGNVVTGN